MEGRSASTEVCRFQEVVKCVKVSASAIVTTTSAVSSRKQSAVSSQQQSAVSSQQQSEAVSSQQSAVSRKDSSFSFL